MKIIHTKEAPQAIGPYSQAIVHHGMLYTSGQIPLDKDGNLISGDIKAQTKQVLANLKAILEAAGAKPSHVIKTLVFLADMNDFAAFNAVYGEFFGSHAPARSTVGVKSLPKNALIEIECIAKLD